jgi:uncharacterized membrane protein YgaE (UPF0421/DUF939 family)
LYFEDAFESSGDVPSAAVGAVLLTISPIFFWFWATGAMGSSLGALAVFVSPVTVCIGLFP